MWKCSAVPWMATSCCLHKNYAVMVAVVSSTQRFSGSSVCQSWGQKLKTNSSLQNYKNFKRQDVNLFTWHEHGNHCLTSSMSALCSIFNWSSSCFLSFFCLKHMKRYNTVLTRILWTIVVILLLSTLTRNTIKGNHKKASCFYNAASLRV